MGADSQASEVMMTENGRKPDSGNAHERCQALVEIRGLNGTVQCRNLAVRVETIEDKGPQRLCLQHSDQAHRLGMVK
jgi:hypothetical protein